MVEPTTFKVIPLAPRPLKPDEAVVAEVERLLAWAKEGKLVGIAGAWLDEKYEVTYFRRGVCNCATVGGLATIQMLICQHVTDTAESI